MTALTPEQLAIAEFDPNDNLVVEAVAGAGKTTVLAYRIKTMLDSGIAPANILVCTFSRSQAEDMALRILSFLKKSYPTIELSELANGFGQGMGQITTIHATARRMLVYYPVQAPTTPTLLALLDSSVAQHAPTASQFAVVPTFHHRHFPKESFQFRFPLAVYFLFSFCSSFQ